MEKLGKIILLLAIFGFAGISTGKEWKLKAGEATFIATGNPSFLTIEGEGAKLKSGFLNQEGNKLTGQIAFSLVGLSTGLSLRDKHLHEKYLGTGAFPVAILNLDNADLATKVFSGKLKVKEDEKPVFGTFTINGKNISASFKINLSDFAAIGVPSWQGITVANEVVINVKIIRF